MFLVCLATSYIRVTFRTVLDLVQALFLSVETLQLNHIESVNQQSRLDCVVQRAVGAETGTQVYLDEPRFQIGVKKDVEPKYFKAISPVHLILLLCLDHIVLTACHGLNNDIEYAGPKQRHVNTYRLQMLTESREAPLEAEVIMFRSFILNEVLVLLVDRVVRQMHVLIVLVELRCVGL